MLTRQQKRQQQRQQAKVRSINATPLALGMLVVFDPTLWRPQPEPVQSIATDCNRVAAAAEPAAEATKTCSRCKETLLASKFYAHPRYSDGLQSRCKACTNECGAIAKAKRAGADAEANAGAGVGTETKRCDKCRHTKPLEAFSKRGGRLAFGSLDGHRSTCKACVKPRIKARGIPKPPKIQGTTKPGNRPGALASNTLILTPEFIQQAHEKAIKAEKDAQILRGVAGVENDTPRQTERKYTPSGWPIDVFERSAQKIRKDYGQSRSNHRPGEEPLNVAA